MAEVNNKKVKGNKICVLTVEGKTLIEVSEALVKLGKAVNDQGWHFE